MIKIDVGCGFHKLGGYVGVDVNPATNPDVLADIENGLPLGDDVADACYSSHCLEHVIDPLFVLGEIHRVCIHGAKITIKIPLNFPDPAHKVIFDDGWVFSYISPRLFRLVSYRAETINTTSCYGVPFSYVQATVELENLKKE